MNLVRWNILWIIPTFFILVQFYIESFVGHLTYNQEWFLAHLTLFYILLLYRWYKIVHLKCIKKLFLSLYFFICGYWKEIFHLFLILDAISLNDFIVAHVMLQVGVSVFIYGYF